MCLRVTSIPQAAEGSLRSTEMTSNSQMSCTLGFLESQVSQRKSIQRRGQGDLFAAGETAPPVMVTAGFLVSAVLS